MKKSSKLSLANKFLIYKVVTNRYNHTGCKPGARHVFKSRNPEIASRSLYQTRSSVASSKSTPSATRLASRLANRLKDQSESPKDLLIECQDQRRLKLIVRSSAWDDKKFFTLERLEGTGLKPLLADVRHAFSRQMAGHLGHFKRRSCSPSPKFSAAV